MPNTTVAPRQVRFNSFDVQQEDFSNSTYIYYGRIRTTPAGATVWEVARHTRATGQRMISDPGQNSSYADFAAYWSARASLTYSRG